MQLPESLVGTALGTALLPTMSEQIVKGENAGFRSTLEKTIRVITALTIPVTFILAFNLKPIIQLLGFDQSGTELVLWTVRAYLVGLVGHSLLEVAARSFYAQHNAKTPLVASGLTSTGFIILAIPLSRSLGAPGIGLANSLVFSGEAVLLFFLLNRIRPFSPRLKGTLLRALAASLISVAVSIILQNIFGAPVSSLVSLLLASGIILFSGLCAFPWILPEIRELLMI